MDDQTPDIISGTDHPPPDTAATVQQSEGVDNGDEGPSEKVKNIASKDRILDCFLKALEACGVVGEGKVAKACYLALTSRVLE